MSGAEGAGAAEPPRDCRLCPRLASFRDANREAYTDYFNGAVPTFGTVDARLLIVGLAPGLHGANKTGRPFTGDYAGQLLYRTLRHHGLARGDYGERADDGLTLVDCAIANAVRCVPPENKPLPSEIKTCRQFLTRLIGEMRNLRAVLALGKIAHDSVCDALGASKSKNVFKHGARYSIDGERPLSLIASYHCSRYNTNTGVLTEKMFDEVVAQAKTAAGV